MPGKLLSSIRAPFHYEEDGSIVENFGNVPLELLHFGDQDRYLVVGWLDGYVDVFDSFEDFRLVKSVKCHRKSVRSLILSQDGQTIFTTSADRSLKKWNLHRWLEDSTKGPVWKQINAHV
jgi:WD40 repeat protein